MRPAVIPSALALLLLTSACSSSYGGDPAGDQSNLDTSIVPTPTPDAELDKPLKPAAPTPPAAPAQPATLPALSRTTFLYSRTIRPGATHLVAHDSTTGEDAVVNRFGDDGTPSSGADVRGVALSPDRRSIAFAATYGITAEDVTLGSGANPVWSMSIQGRDPKRLTLPIPSPAGVTAYGAFQSDPAWSHDGQTVFFTFGQSFLSANLLVAGSHLVSASRAKPGPTTVRVSGPSCRFGGQPATSPDGKRLLLHQSGCSGGHPEGLFTMPADASADAVLAVDLAFVSQIVREGQGAFRARVLDAYGRQCAVTGEHTEPVLDAAHIQPYRGVRSNHVQNGLLLTKEFHALFDLGYVAVTPDYKVRVSTALKTDFKNGKRYYPYDGQRLAALPERAELRPSPEALEWHLEHVFRRAS